MHRADQYISVSQIFCIAYVYSFHNFEEKNYSQSFFYEIIKSRKTHMLIPRQRKILKTGIKTYSTTQP